MRDSVTNLDPTGGANWAVNDPVVRFREWGTERVHHLPGTAGGSWMIGRSTSAWLQLDDMQRLVSRRHAELSREAAGWLLRDVGSTNGLWRDDEREESFQLVPGAEICVGPFRLIAESARLLEIRALLARLIGTHHFRRSDVDFALRSLREMATLKRPLLLCGDGDLGVVANQMHRAAVGTDRPFVLCDPRRRRVASTARALGNEPELSTAVETAGGGTLCLWVRNVPAGFDKIAQTLRDPGKRVRLMLFAERMDLVSSIAAARIVLPALSTRLDELPRIVDEYASEAIERFGADTQGFTAEDRNLVVARRPTTLAIIAQATARIVAIRHFGGVTRAAPHLGLSHVALSRWIARFRDGREQG